MAKVSAGEETSSFVSIMLLSINILLFVAITGVEMKNGRGSEALTSGASSPVLLDFGSFYKGLVNQGEWWRFITPNFLHIGLMHVLFNSFALYQVGPLTEELYGSAKFIFIYLITGIFAFVASYFFDIRGAGASGSICGLIGLMAVFGYRQGGSFGKSLMRSMVQWAVMIIIFGFIVGANNVGHMGGLISGALLGFLIKGEQPTTLMATRAWNGTAILCVVLIALSFAMVGKNYGAQQEGFKQFDVNKTRREQGADNLITLSRFIWNADKTINSISASEQPPEARQIAIQLREIAVKISGIPAIDEESNAIRTQITDTLNQVVTSLESSNKNTARQKKPLSEIQNDWSVLFKTYRQWEAKVLPDYGLEYEK